MFGPNVREEEVVRILDGSPGWGSFRFRKLAVTETK